MVAFSIFVLTTTLLAAATPAKISPPVSAYTSRVPDSCADENGKSYRKNAENNRPACTAHFPERGELGQGMTAERFRWPEATVPYIISRAFDACRRDLILEAMREIREKTNDCITFVERTDEEDYVEIINTDKGCWSELGRIGGRQELNLEDTENACFYREVGSGVGSGTPAHELIHALGFTHEHQRSDRDDYIRVDFQNVIPKQAFNFNITKGQTLIGKYDYGSIMHYNEYAFSRNKKRTMIAKQRGVVFGKADELSRQDVKKIMTYYKCR